jgi:hypothetical protein
MGERRKGTEWRNEGYGMDEKGKVTPSPLILSPEGRGELIQRISLQHPAGTSYKICYGWSRAVGERDGLRFSTEWAKGRRLTNMRIKDV